MFLEKDGKNEQSAGDKLWSFVRVPYTVSRRMKVVHVLWSAEFGGVQRLVLDLASVQSKDPKLRIAVLFGNENGQGEFVERFREAGLTCHFVHLNSGHDLSPWKYLNAIRIFRDNDILHFHHFNPLVAACAVISQKKIIYTVHSSPDRRKMKWADYARTSSLKWFLNARTDYTSFNSEYTRKVAEKRYGLRGVTGAVIYNGITFKEGHTCLEGIEEAILQKICKKFVVGTTSRFKGPKCIDRLIRGFADFQRNRDTILLLVGEGVLREELEQLTKRLKLSDKVYFTGFRQNVRDFQSLMDVCVYPFRSEAFGLVAAETLSLGKPVIVFEDGGGLVEVVGEFSQDDVVGDIPQLVRRLEYYYENRGETTTLSHDRIGYSRKFDIRNMVSQFKTVYEGLVRSSEKGARRSIS